MAVGIEQNRLSLLLAVLEKRAGLHLVDRRCVREHRGRHEHRGAGRRSGHRVGRCLERAQPPADHRHGGLRRGRPRRRESAACPRRGSGFAKPSRWALRASSCRSPTSTASWLPACAEPGKPSSSASATSAKRSTRCSRDRAFKRTDPPSLASNWGASFGEAGQTNQTDQTDLDLPLRAVYCSVVIPGLIRGVSWPGFILARLLFTGAVVYTAFLLRPIGTDAARQSSLFGLALAGVAVFFEWRLRDLALTNAARRAARRRRSGC